MPNAGARSLLTLLAPSLAAALLLGLGVGAGRWMEARAAEREVSLHARVTTLGEYAAQLNREAFARAYHDPERALREMDGYAWVVPQVPTPGVGSAPAPGRHASANINAQQFRRSDRVEVPKPARLLRVFVTGGSTAFGTGAPDDASTIPGYLERELRTALGRRVEVINAANTAWASTHERSWIVDRILDLEPDLVVSLSGINDVHWALLGRNVLSMRAYADEHWFALISDLYRRASAPLLDPVEVTPERADPSVVARRLARNARLSAAALASEGTPYLFALQPTLAVTAKPLTRKERWQRGLIDQRFGDGARDYTVGCYAEIRAQLAPPSQQPVAFADLSPVFDGAGADTEIFLDSYHFGDRGNEIIARALVDPVVALLAGR